jgi:type VI secretion system protein ImpL
VARARAEQLRVPVEERAYGRIKRAPVEDLRGFSIMTAAGSDAGVVFVRKSGAGLREETPPLYTRDGYFKIFLPGATQIATNLLEEQWVLGENAGAGALGDTAATTERIRELYLRDYAQTYEELLLDLDLAPFGTPQQASTILRVLSADESPLLKLLTAVRDETNLQDSVDVEQIAEATEEIAAQQQQLAGILNRTRVGSGINRAVERMSHVQRRFDSLHELVPEDGDGPMTRVLELLRELYEFMNLVARQGDSLPAHMAESGEASIQQLENEAAGQPAFLENIMSSAASQTSRVAFGGVANYINDEWNARAAGFCRDAIAGRYPIDRNSSREIQLQDFAEFFGPDGIMQSFFDTFLAEYVDASRRPWRVKSARATAFSLQPDALGQFERARAIREVFFKGGSGPAVSFELRPERLDASLEEFSMSLGGKRIVYRSGPRFAEVMNWPGGDGATAVQIQMLPAGPSGRTMIEERGPWAWFRILDQASIQPTSNPETFTVQFTLDGRTASYELAARSAFNPFDLPELGEFSCPKSL